MISGGLLKLRNLLARAIVRAVAYVGRIGLVLRVKPKQITGHPRNHSQSPLSPEEVVRAIAVVSRDSESCDRSLYSALMNGRHLTDEHGDSKVFVYTDAVVRECLNTIAILYSGDIDWAKRYIALLLTVLRLNRVAKHYFDAVVAVCIELLKLELTNNVKALLEQANDFCESHGGPPSPEQRRQLATVGIQSGQCAEKASDDLLAEWLYSYASQISFGFDKGLEGGSYQCLAGVHARLGRKEEAQRCLSKALVLFDACGDEENLAGARMELALLDMRSGRFLAARQNMIRALEFFERGGGDCFSLPRCLFYLTEADLEAGCGSLNEHLEKNTRALALVRQRRDSVLEKPLIGQRRRILFNSPRFEWYW
jgi:tetratricopeptide (TPR) repeat protein